MTVFILIPWFYPAYKAGGPIQSIANLVDQYNIDTRFRIYTSDTDMDGTKSPDIISDRWTNHNDNTEVYYCSKGNQKISTIKKEINNVKPDILFINGLFNWHFNIAPLLFCKFPVKILSARGMLQPGALNVKPFKKKVFLTIVNASGKLDKIIWHATNAEEVIDIKRTFGSSAKVVVAGNIPKKPVASLNYPAKQMNQLRLVYLSLITEKKNLLLLIDIISRCSQGITLDIYGPIKDQEYWEKCNARIKNNEERIKYKGDVDPKQVQDVFMKYDASILLTKGENFGHAIYESLSVGRPVITSYFTPWNKLKERQGGWNVDIDEEEEMVGLIKQIQKMNKFEYDLFCDGAYQLASEYYSSSDFEKAYFQLFSLK